MRAAASTLVLVLGLTACGGRATPPSRPAPATANTRTVAGAAARRDTTRMPDTIPTVVIAIPDSVLTRQVAAVFGDSVAAGAVETVPEGPRGDIDVRSYETHRRVEFYVNAFTGSARERLIPRLEKGSRYEPM